MNGSFSPTGAIASPGLPGVAAMAGAGDAARGLKPLLLVSELEDYTISFANGVAQHLPLLLAVPRRRFAELAEWFDPAVDLRLLDWPRHRSLSNILFLAALMRLVRRERPSVIHMLSNNTLWLNLVAPFGAALRSSLPSMTSRCIRATPRRRRCRAGRHG